MIYTERELLRISWRKIWHPEGRTMMKDFSWGEAAHATTGVNAACGRQGLLLV